MKWQDKISKEQIKHLRAMGIRTLTQAKRNANSQALMRSLGGFEPCWGVQHHKPKARIASMNADELKAARKRLGMTQKELATILNTSIRTYQQWEQGRFNIPGIVKPALLMLCELRNR